MNKLRSLAPVAAAAGAVLALALAAGPAAAGDNRCAACGKEITGSYFETNGEYYHPEHFTCDHCGEPITGQYSVHKGKKYHGGCFENDVALRCSVCNEIIQGKYLLDHWGNAYHGWHRGDVTNCDFCGRLITGALIDGMTRFNDGRYLCGICNSTAVTDLAEAKAIMEDVAEQLARYGLIIDHEQVNLHLVGKDVLQQLAGKDAHGLRGFTDYEHLRNMFGVLKYRKIHVNILYGMPRVETISTMAHELTHVFQFLEGQPISDPALLEGSCNFAAYLVLKKMGGEDAEFIINNMMADENPTYGGGFRRVKRHVDRYGLRSWVELLQRGRLVRASF